MAGRPPLQVRMRQASAAAAQLAGEVPGVPPGNVGLLGVDTAEVIEPAAFGKEASAPLRVVVLGQCRFVR